LELDWVEEDKRSAAVAWEVDFTLSAVLLCNYVEEVRR